MKALPLTVQKLWPMSKFLRTDRRTVITIGCPPSGRGHFDFKYDHCKHLNIRFIEIWSPKWDNVWEMVVSKITMVVVSVHKLSHYIKCCRGNLGLVGCATHLELRQTSTKPLKKLPCTAKNWMARNYCILDADWLWIHLPSWYFSDSDFLFVIKSRLDIYIYKSKK